MQRLLVLTDKEQFDCLQSKDVGDLTILRYYLFCNDTDDYPGRIAISKHKTMVLGMSHSQCGICDEYIDKDKVIKYSLPSMDLFLQLKLFERMADDNPKALNNITSIVLELPYYIFNYDLSRFGTFTYTKLNYFYHFSDYHNFVSCDNDKVVLKEYELYKELFSHVSPIDCASAKPKHLTLKKIINYMIYKVSSVAHIVTNHDKVWTKCYNETIEENIGIIKSLVDRMKQFCPKAKINVLIMPFNPLFRISHKKEILKTKTLFYSILNDLSDINIIDHFSVCYNPFLFDDHCHLSKLGAKKYTKKLINQHIL